MSLEKIEETPKKSKKPKKPQPPFFSFENFKSLASLVLIIFAIRWSIISPYQVPTPSMEPTIQVGDRLLAWKLAYDFKIPFTYTSLFKISEVKRGDIIVFQSPSQPSLDFVKRVVGLPGDQLRIVDDVLYVNGEPQEKMNHEFDRTILEESTDHPDLKILYRENLTGVEHWTADFIPSARHFGRSNWPENGFVTVPEDSYYCFGDNRHNSDDSRSWGKVPRENIKGKASIILWSMYWPEDSFLPKFRWDRFGQFLDSY